MVMKGYSTFPKTPALLKTHHQIVCYHIQDTCWGESYLFAEKQSVYSAVLADWTKEYLEPDKWLEKNKKVQ